MKDFLKSNYGITNELFSIYERALNKIQPYLNDIDKISDYNTVGLSGGDSKNDKIYAQVFGAEDAIVRHNIVNGTAAIAACYFGVLRPGDTILAATGRPYDTLEEVIGIRGEGMGSLKEFGVNYKEVALKDNKVDFDALKEAIDPTVKVVALQRSKGYSW